MAAAPLRQAPRAARANVSTAPSVPNMPACPEPPSRVSAQAFSSCTAPRTSPPRAATTSVGAARASKPIPAAWRARAVPNQLAEAQGLGDELPYGLARISGSDGAREGHAREDVPEIRRRAARGRRGLCSGGASACASDAATSTALAPKRPSSRSS